MSMWVKKSQPDEGSGFSLVELLVVVAILAILAAIAIPLFLGQKKKAEASALQSDMRNLVMEVEGLKMNIPPGVRFENGGVFATGYPDYNNLKPEILDSGWKKSNSAFSFHIDFNCMLNPSGTAAIGDGTVPFFGSGEADGYYLVRGRTKNSVAGDQTVTQYVYDSKTSTWYEEEQFNNGGLWGSASAGCRYHFGL